MIKAVLFDFDGVLTTDKTGSETIGKYISAQANIEYESFRLAYRKYNDDLLCGKFTHRDIWDSLCEDIGVKIEYSILEDSFINTPIDAKMLELLKLLKSKNYKTAMITDNKADRMDAIVSHLNWSGLFDVIAVSAKVGTGKEHQAIFNITLEKLMLLPNECVFIDNKHDNLLAPASVGMHTLFFDDLQRDIEGLKIQLDALGVLC